MMKIMIIAIMFIAPIFAQNETDSLTLVALYNSTNGDEWEHNEGWLTDAPHCEWYGITCENGNVTELSLYFNNLTGEIPAELGNLSNLRSLYLHSNDLTGEIPSELGNLSNLESMRLYSNNLTGEIPAEFSNLSNLESLELENNQLSGIIPENLCNLDLSWSSSRHFDISQNQLCPPYPLCLAEYVGEQDLTNCASIGDLNQDFAFDILDAVQLVFIILGELIPNEYELWAGDLNEDGALDILDILCW